MSIRWRIILAVVFISLVTLSLVVFRANLIFNEILSQAAQKGRDALEQAGRQSIRQSAYATAKQVSLYLAAHPEIDWHDAASLEGDRNLAELAVQPVGLTGYTAVFDSQGITHFHPNPQIVGMDMSTLAEKLPEFWAIFKAGLGGSPSEGYYDWIEADGSVRQKFMVVVPVAGTDLRVAATTYIDEFSQPIVSLEQAIGEQIRVARLRLIGIGLLGTLIAAAWAVYVGLRFSRPLSRMAVSAERVARGEWEALKPLPERNELGILSRALYSMTNQLRSVQENLESQVEARTQELSRRTGQLEIAAQVAREASAIRDVGQLLDQQVRLIAERFDFYHVAIYLIDEAREYAVLRASNSEGGQRMLARGHKLRLGIEGIVGWVGSAGRPRLAFNVGEDQQYFRNPDLPQTRSEAALPLRVRERVIGVLDVQSLKPSAFTLDDIGVLQIVADQIALALENARLFEETQQALQTLNRVYGQQTQQAWYQRLRERPIAFRYDLLGVQPATQQAETQAVTSRVEIRSVDGHHELIAPILIHGQSLGTLLLRREANQPAWTTKDVSLVELILEQIAPALESARLLEEVQARAAREQAVNVITGRLRSSISMDAILQNAVRELGLVLGASRTFVQVGLEQIGEENRQAKGKGGSYENQ